MLNLNSIVLLLVVTLVALLPLLPGSCADTEIDNLVAQFQSNLNSVSSKVGASSTQINANPAVQELEAVMREVYGNLERTLNEVRQNIANSRTTALIDKVHQLKLL